MPRNSFATSWAVSRCRCAALHKAGAGGTHTRSCWAPRCRRLSTCLLQPEPNEPSSLRHHAAQVPVQTGTVPTAKRCVPNSPSPRALAAAAAAEFASSIADSPATARRVGHDGVKQAGRSGAAGVADSAPGGRRPAVLRVQAHHLPPRRRLPRGRRRQGRPHHRRLLRHRRGANRSFTTS